MCVLSIIFWSSCDVLFFNLHLLLLLLLFISYLVDGLQHLSGKEYHVVDVVRAIFITDVLCLIRLLHRVVVP